MKLSNTSLYVLLISLVVLCSCHNKQQQQQEQEQGIKKPKGTISFERAKVLQKEYLKTRASVLNTFLNNKNHFKEQSIIDDDKKYTKDVVDVTFSLETIKQYIAYVEQEAKSKGLKGLGLRIYFGAYPMDDPKSKEPGFSTVFFMPTHQVEPNTNNANSFFYWYENRLMEGVDGLNYGNAGRPPHSL